MTRLHVGKLVSAQLMDHLPWKTFSRIVERYRCLYARVRLALIETSGSIRTRSEEALELMSKIALDPNNPGTSSGTSAAVATKATAYSLRAWPPQRRESRSCDSPNPKRHRTLARERPRNPLASGRD